MAFITELYRATTRFPKEELYGLTAQVRRAAVSIAMNIAEGSAAGSDLEFRRYLTIAARSGYEAMCGIEVAIQLGYLDVRTGNALLDRLEELSAMLYSFRGKLEAEG